MIDLKGKVAVVFGLANKRSIAYSVASVTDGTANTIFSVSGSGSQLTADIAKDSKGSISPSADGVFLTSESNRHAVLKFENDIPGADDRPLLASARIRTGSMVGGGSSVRTQRRLRVRPGARVHG